MKYVPMKKGVFSRTALYGRNGVKLELPKGMTVRFRNIGYQTYFELEIDGKVTTPALQAVEPSGKVWTMHLHDGGRFDMNIETFEHTPVYDEAIEQIKISKNGKLIFSDASGHISESDLVLDKESLGEGVYDRYFFKTLIGVKNPQGKCAIIDSETSVYLTGFEFESEKYDIVDALNNETNVVGYNRIYVIESKGDSNNNYLLIDENGKTLKRFEAKKCLWNFAREEKVGDTTKRFVYSAFAAKTKDGKEYTKIFKIDCKTEEIVFETNIKGMIKRDVQFRDYFVELDNGAIVFKTSEMNEKTNTEMFGASILYPDGTAKVVRANEHEDIVRASDPKNGKYLLQNEPVLITKKLDENGNLRYGAVKLSKDQVVEVLLDTVWLKVDVERDSKGNYFLEFIGDKKFGKIPLSSPDKGYEVSVSSFVSLANKHFGLSRDSKTTEVAVRAQKSTNSSKGLSTSKTASIFDLLGTPKNKQNGEE